MDVKRTIVPAVAAITDQQTVQLAKIIAGRNAL